MKHKTLQRIARIKQEILAGTPYPVMVVRLSEEFGVAQRTMDALITKANQQLLEEQEKEDVARAAANAQVLKEEAQEIALTMKDIGLYLSRVIRGEKKEQKAMSTKEGVQVVEVAVHTREMLKAINLYCRYAEMLGLKDQPEEEKITGFYIISRQDHEKRVANGWQNGSKENQPQEAVSAKETKPEEAEVVSKANTPTPVDGIKEEPVRMDYSDGAPPYPARPVHAVTRNSPPVKPGSEPRPEIDMRGETLRERYRKEVLEMRSVIRY